MIHNILNRWCSVPWAITPEAMQARMLQLHQWARDKSTMPIPSAALPKRPTEDWMGNPLPQMRVENGVAIVPIHGELVKGATPFDRWVFGDVDYDDVREDVAKAATQADVVMLHIKSPGGMVIGLHEAVELIESVGRTVEIRAYTDMQMASAAYSLALGTGGISASHSSMVGSVGAILTVQTMVGMAKMFGVEFEVFRSGDLKATGHKFKEIEGQEWEYVQGIVDESGIEFRDYVHDRRVQMTGYDVKENYLRGQMFNGSEALEINLIDSIHSSLSDAIRPFQSFS